jgi:ATP-dependent protease ClpP protease subunit
VFLYNFIRGLPIKVIMHNLGSISSIAASVFVAADERYCSPHAVFIAALALAGFCYPRPVVRNGLARDR